MSLFELYLAEKELVLPVGVGPVLLALASHLVDPPVFPLPPGLNPFPDAVDSVARLDSTLRPLHVKLDWLALFLGTGNGKK